MQVIFTQRAYVSVLAETAEKIQTETGGIFLGYRDADTWYVVEAIDPGPKSVFQVAYFEYDTKYVNHLVNKIARLYSRPLNLLGLWHRHPGSLDRFSGTDDRTNMKFASLHRDGAISGLVNIDPEFRLTVYHVTSPLAYHRVTYKVGDELIPHQFRTLCDAQRLLDYTSARVDSIWGVQKVKQPKYKYDAILNEVIKNLGCIEISKEIDEDQLPNLSDEEIDLLLQETESDLLYFGECGMKFQMNLRGKYLLAKSAGQELYFGIAPQNHACMFKYGERFYLYRSRMFVYIFDDIIKSVKQTPKIWGFTKGLVINKELIECSLRRFKSN